MAWYDFLMFWKKKPDYAALLDTITQQVEDVKTSMLGKRPADNSPPEAKYKWYKLRVEILSNKDLPPIVRMAASYAGNEALFDSYFQTYHKVIESGPGAVKELKEKDRTIERGLAYELGRLTNKMEIWKEQAAGDWAQVLVKFNEDLEHAKTRFELLDSKKDQSDNDNKVFVVETVKTLRNKAINIGARLWWTGHDEKLINDYHAAILNLLDDKTEDKLAAETKIHELESIMEATAKEHAKKLVAEFPHFFE